jgi:hypothetical protein
VAAVAGATVAWLIRGRPSRDRQGSPVHRNRRRALLVLVIILVGLVAAAGPAAGGRPSPASAGGKTR